MTSLIVDLFAGGGGASHGIERALGRSVDIAINHDAHAIAMHTINHPDTLHFQSDIFEVDPHIVCQGKPVGLLWASPDCKHFSKAKGGKPRSKKIRSLAWIVVKWAKSVRPRVIILENVEEFQTWGPLDDQDKPIKSKSGQIFDLWKAQLRKLGYQLEHKELIASDYGVPTIRKRFFMIARCDGQSINWPVPTHGNPNIVSTTPHLTLWKSAAECIDWSLPCPSIFNRVRPLAEKTLKRIENGINKFIVNHSSPYLRPASEGPFQSIQAHFITECANGSGQRNFAINEPLRTQCAEVKGGHFALVSAFLIKYYGNDKNGQSLQAPLHTITTKDRLGLVLVHLDQQTYQIVDIGLRMLQPHELFKAQGFLDSYQIDFNVNGKPLSKASKVRLCGNSVCPPLAEQLVALNYSIPATQTVAF